MHIRQFIAPKLQNPVVVCNSILLQDSVTLCDMETVGDRIRAARKAKGLTMDELARAIGKKESYISELERGGIKRGSQLHKIAAALNVPLVWMESGTGKTSQILKLLQDTGAADRPVLLLGDESEGNRIADTTREWSAAMYRSSPETKAAVTLLLLPRQERTALIKESPALVAAVELLEALAPDALKRRADR